MKMNISAYIVKTFLNAITEDKTRGYLNAVRVEPVADGGVVMTATDGQILFSIFDPSASISEAKSVRIGKAGLKTVTVSSRLVIEDDSNIAYIKDQDYVVGVENEPFNTNDGFYPDWRRIIGDESRYVGVSPERNFVNTEFLEKVGKVGKEVGKVFFVSEAGVSIHVADNRTYPVLLNWASLNMIALVMGLRSSNEEYASKVIPAWAKVQY